MPCLTKSGAPRSGDPEIERILDDFAREDHEARQPEDPHDWDPEDADDWWVFHADLGDR